MLFALVMSLSQLAGAAQDGVWRLVPTPEAIKQAGGRVVGQLQTKTDDSATLVQLGRTGCIVLPTKGLFNAQHGSLAFQVRPTWSGDDHQSHAFFHLGGGQAHVTVFKTDNGSLRFVYKASSAHYSACDVRVTDWQPGQMHEIAAGWVQDYSGKLLLQLAVDGKCVRQSGGTPLSEVPAQMFLGRRGLKAQPADAWMGNFRLSCAPPKLPYATGPKPAIVARVDCSATTPLRKVHDFTTIWNSRDNPLPFRVGDPEYQRFLDARFRMVRLVAFSEGWLWGTRVEVDAQGQLVTDFADFDRLLDVFQQAGAEPYIRLAYHTPRALVDPQLPREQQGYAPPVNLELWDELMERIVRHVRLQRNLPVRYWVTALNEGDIPVLRGQADPQTIYELYGRTSKLVKRLDPEARVGGPALAWSVDADGQPTRMLVDFLRFCRHHQLPLDFLCFHGYRKAHPRDYEALIRTIRSTLEAEWPERAGQMEYFLDEWNLWNRDRLQDNEYAAAYLAAALHYQRRAKLTKSSIVSFNHFLPTAQPAAELIRRTGPFKRDAKSPVCFEVGTWKCGDRSRRGIRLHPPGGRKAYSYCTFPVLVPASGRPRLQLATGIAGNYAQCDGCGFQVVVIDAKRQTVLLERGQRTRPWQSHELALDRFAGRRVDVELRTDAGPKGHSAGDWAIWAEPCVIVTDEKGKDQVAVSLLSQVAEACAGARRAGWTFEYDDATIAQFTGLPLIKGPVVTTPFFVWLMHRRLGEKELAVELTGKEGVLGDDSGGLTATAGAKSDEAPVALLLWHFDLLRGQPRRWTIRIEKLPEALRKASVVQLTEYRIDHEHNNPYTDYVLKRQDTNGGEYNLETAALKPLRQGRLTIRDGRLVVDLELPNMSVSLLELAPAE